MFSEKDIRIFSGKSIYLSGSDHISIHKKGFIARQMLRETNPFSSIITLYAVCMQVGSAG